MFCLHICMCTTSMPCAHSGQKRVLDPLELVEGKVLACTDKHRKRQEKLNMHTCLFKDVCLFSWNAGKEHSSQPGDPLLSDESGSTYIPQNLCFTYILDLSPSKY